MKGQEEKKRIKRAEGNVEKRATKKVTKAKFSLTTVE